jgi:hypothetical protein
VSVPVRYLTVDPREVTLQYVVLGIYLLSLEIRSAQRRGLDAVAAVEASPMASAVWSAFFPKTSPARVLQQLQRSGRPVAKELSKLLTGVLHV